MARWVRLISMTSSWFNYIAGFAIVVMMLISCADVAMRFFGAPIPGAYEMVGFIGVLVVSLSLAQTSLQRGHVAVELFFNKFPQRMQLIVEALGNLTSAALFAIVSWQSIKYALDLRRSGEVSLTLQMPLHPVVFSIAAGCALLALVLLTDFMRSVRRSMAK